MNITEFRNLIICCCEISKTASLLITAGRLANVALCCPEASGRQGNIAYTLLWDGYKLILFYIPLNSFVLISLFLI